MLIYLVEFLGTFLFTSVYVATQQPIIASLAFLLILVLGGGISGSHYNPVTSLAFWLNGVLSDTAFIGYIIAQILGGLSALTIYNYLGPKVL
jgi:glycerol uptake facilitator-like aquaporin